MYIDKNAQKRINLFLNYTKITENNPKYRKMFPEPTIRRLAKSH